MPVLLMTLLPLLLKLAPDLVGLAFGGAGQAVAAKVAKAATDVFGTDDAASVATQAAADPAKADAFATRLATETEILKAELADTANARATTVALTKERSSIAWGAPVVSLTVTLGFIGVLATLTLHTLPDSGVVNVLVGTLATAFGSVVNFWLGSSAGSHAKSEQLASLANAVAGHR